MKNLFYLLFMLLGVHPILAQNTIINTTEDGNWTSANVWSSANAPSSNIGSNTHLIIRDSVFLDNDLEINGTLTIESGGVLVLSSGNNIEVKNGTLNVEGKLYADDANIINGSGRINFKSGSESYFKNFTNNTTGGNLTIETNAMIYVSGNFSSTGSATNNGTIKVEGDYHATNLQNDGDILVIGNISGTTTGTPPQSVTALPIELLFFEARVEEEAVKLKWATASEVDNDFFTIERADKEGIFQPIATIDGAGNSIHQINYETTDRFPNMGINYYRLKQTDFDGTYEYAKVVAVKLGDVFEGMNISVFPNPATDRLFVSVPHRLSESAVLNLIDQSGRLRKTKTITGHEGNVVNLNLDGLTKGVYILQLLGNDQQFTQKVILH